MSDVQVVRQWGDMAVVDDARAVTAPRREAADRELGGQNWADWYIRRALGVDFLVVLLAGLVGFFGRFGPTVRPYELSYLVMTGALPFAWVACVALSRGYEPRFVGVGSDEFRKVFNVGVTLIAAIAIGSYATKTELARGYVVLALPLAITADLAGRFVLRKHLHRLYRQGRCLRRVIVVGHEAAIVNLVATLRRERHHGMAIVGACLPTLPLEHDGRIPGADGVPVLGDFSEVAPAVEATGAETVAVLACTEITGEALRRLAWQLEKRDTELIVSPGLMDVAGPRTTIRPIAGLPLLHVEHPELVGVRRLLKDVFDRLVAALALVVLAPLFAVVALTIRATSPGPAFFRQTRVGRDGREFTLYKFRTMSVDAEERKAELAERNEHDGVLFKIRDDPRVTPIGARLRRYSIDELPQLVNVILGHMSLVGPRPPLPEEVARYGDDVRRRLVVKPGLTGLWQISGRSDLSWEESVRLDLRYVENWSLAFDLVILWKTWSAVIRGSGAY